MISDPDQKSQFTILHKHEANYVEQFLMKKTEKLCNVAKIVMMRLSYYVCIVQNNMLML